MGDLARWACVHFLGVRGTGRHESGAPTLAVKLVMRGDRARDGDGSGAACEQRERRFRMDWRHEPLFLRMLLGSVHRHSWQLRTSPGAEVGVQVGLRFDYDLTSSVEQSDENETTAPLIEYVTLAPTVSLTPAPVTEYLTRAPAVRVSQSLQQNFGAMETFPFVERFVEVPRPQIPQIIDRIVSIDAEQCVEAKQIVNRTVPCDVELMAVVKQMDGRFEVQPLLLNNNHLYHMPVPQKIGRDF